MKTNHGRKCVNRMIVGIGGVDAAYSHLHRSLKAFGMMRELDHQPALTISNDMPESGGGCSAGVTDGPEVAASDDDDDGDGDGDPDRRPKARSKKSPPSFPPALLQFAPLSHYVGFGRSRIYQLINAGEFPPPVKVGKSSRWVKTEIDAWLTSQIAARQSNLTAG